MPVRRPLVALFALAVLFIVGGCGRGGSALTADETTDPLYQRAQDFKKQNRNGEALNAFLKVIDRRGEAGAPESHLEAGVLYLTRFQDPVAAYYHFRRCLELQPTGTRADMVRGQLDAAKREVARVLFAPASSQSMWSDRNGEVEQLRRRVQELEAENQTLRGGAVGAIARVPAMIALLEGRPAAATDATDSPIAPAGTMPDSPFTRALAAPVAPPGQVIAAPIAVPDPDRTAVTPARSDGAPQKSASQVAARRSHTVAPRESLWAIARRYYGPNPSAAQVDAIYRANTDVMSSPTDLRPGVVLRIP